MTEALAATADFPEEIQTPEEAETGANTRTKVMTAGLLGILGVAAGYAEARGYVNNFPPPFHSLKHPWVGYYTAWAASKFSRRPSVAVAAGVAGDFAAETAQGISGSSGYVSFDHLSNQHALSWADVAHNPASTNMDNLVDLAACMGGTALFLAQDRGGVTWIRQRLSALRTRLGDSKAPEAALDPVD